MITLIHRQETISLLGLPLMRHIDLDDAESVLQAIRETPAGRPIEIILHTPGGLVLAASQIAIALADHDGPVDGGRPALRDERRHDDRPGRRRDRQLDRHAALGPIDPQLGQYPAASILAALEAPGGHTDEFAHPRRHVAQGAPPGRGTRRAPARASDEPRARPRTSQS